MSGAPAMVQHTIGRQASEATRAALANSQLRYELLETCGHFPWFEVPDRSRSILEEFLGGCHLRDARRSS